MRLVVAPVQGTPRRRRPLPAAALHTNADDGVLHYDWYLSDDGTRCVVRETYADSGAVLAHLPLVSEQLAKIGELCGAAEGGILGVASPELRAMIDATGAHLCHHLQSK